MERLRISVKSNFELTLNTRSQSYVELSGQSAGFQGLMGALVRFAERDADVEHAKIYLRVV